MYLEGGNDRGVQTGFPELVDCAFDAEGVHRDRGGMLLRVAKPG